MLIVIFNHNHNAGAIALRDSLVGIADTCLLDSGSTLSDEERPRFDECHSNIYYSGLLNRAAELVKARPSDEPVVVVCSDVEIQDPRKFRDCIANAFSDPTIMVWAPSSPVDSFAHMVPQGSGGMRPVSFVDGFCFAARRRLFDLVCPVDVAVNRIGWGPDVHFGYCAAVLRGRCVVDDRLTVLHPTGSGYNREIANRQYLDWRKTLAFPARFFHARSRRDKYLEGRGSRLVIGMTFVLAGVYGIVRGSSFRPIRRHP